ncbi:Chaperone DnaJ-domain superfamily protein [Abeliophyllum distichum]|uniref:Chaperone DnaJ-domain superfamily protein n=1 Tax=Abeliophyllum distichum TaxID=126358 RepID=A0ABD1UI42_9LAMI
MECNRDEAARAKEIAERKFLAKDSKGAKKYALKALNLYPELEGVSQMVTTLDVYISAEEKINGEGNWYGVLGVDPLADDETIRKKYRRLALLLHPDKNKSFGAEGAFKLVSEAWSLLSDKYKRLAYDQRSGAKFQPGNWATNGCRSTPSKHNGFYKFAKTAAPQMRVSKGNSAKRDASYVPAPPRKKEGQTFWTVCHRCKMQYECLKMHLNHNLLCPKCLESYFAVETELPSATAQKKATASTGMFEFNDNNSSNHSKSEWTPFSGTTSTASAVQVADLVQQVYERVRKERQKAQAATRREEARRRKNHSSKTRIEAESGHFNAVKRGKGAEDCGTSKDIMELVNGEGLRGST